MLFRLLIVFLVTAMQFSALHAEVFRAIDKSHEPLREVAPSWEYLSDRALMVPEVRKVPARLGLSNFEDENCKFKFDFMLLLAGETTLTEDLDGANVSLVLVDAGGMMHLIDASAFFKEMDKDSGLAFTHMILVHTNKPFSVSQVDFISRNFVSIRVLPQLVRNDKVTVKLYDTYEFPLLELSEQFVKLIGNRNCKT